MEIEFGHVQHYNTARGFGFISLTLEKVKRRHRRNVWFHIKKVKCDYPDLAKELDAGSFAHISFWYKIDNSDGEKVSKIWLEPKDIPKQQRDDLVVYIEQIWCNTSHTLPKWLDQITIALVGQLYRDELYQERNAQIQIRNQQKLEERECLNSQSRFSTRQKRESRLRRVAALGGQNVRRHKVPSRVYIGLPEDLAHHVSWVAREHRTNHLSHIPGGSDVIVEYHSGKVFGYDWIKKPSAYIRTFFAGIVEYASDDFRKMDEQSQSEIARRKIARVFARKYKDESEYSTASFIEVWNSETSNKMLWKALEKFDCTRQIQDDFEEDYIYIPQSKYEYYGYDPVYEDPTNEAERLYGIPDPRLVEE